MRKLRHVQVCIFSTFSLSLWLLCVRVGDFDLRLRRSAKAGDDEISIAPAVFTAIKRSSKHATVRGSGLRSLWSIRLIQNESGTGLDGQQLADLQAELATALVSQCVLPRFHVGVHSLSEATEHQLRHVCHVLPWQDSTFSIIAFALASAYMLLYLEPSAFRSTLHRQ